MPLFLTTIIPLLVRYVLVPVAAGIAGYFVTDDPAGVAAGVGAAAQAIIHAADKRRDEKKRTTSLIKKEN